jgi:hypothetical protein
MMFFDKLYGSFVEHRPHSLFSITKAPITPGTQPQSVRRNTIKKEPHPLSITARGGKNIDKITLKSDIFLCFSN